MMYLSHELTSKDHHFKSQVEVLLQDDDFKNTEKFVWKVGFLKIAKVI